MKKVCIFLVLLTYTIWTFTAAKTPKQSKPFYTHRNWYFRKYANEPKFCYCGY